MAPPTRVGALYLVLIICFFFRSLLSFIGAHDSFRCPETITLCAFFIVLREDALLPGRCFIGLIALLEGSITTRRLILPEDLLDLLTRRFLATPGSSYRNIPWLFLPQDRRALTWCPLVVLTFFQESPLVLLTGRSS